MSRKKRNDKFALGCCEWLCTNDHDTTPFGYLLLAISIGEDGENTESASRLFPSKRGTYGNTKCPESLLQEPAKAESITKTYTQRERSLKNRNYSIKSNFANNIFFAQMCTTLSSCLSTLPLPNCCFTLRNDNFPEYFLKKNKRLIFILTRKKSDPTIELKLF